MPSPSDADQQACEVPLVEQLRSIPKDYRTCRAIQWSDDGRETGHQLIPVGFMMHRAADMIESLQSVSPPPPTTKQAAGLENLRQRVLDFIRTNPRDLADWREEMAEVHHCIEAFAQSLRNDTRQPDTTKRGEQFSDSEIADLLETTIFRLESRCDANKNFAIGEPFAKAMIFEMQEAARRLRSARSETAQPPASEAGRRFPICKDHVSADWNQPSLDDEACVLCRLFYLEAQEGLLEEWQQRAKRAEDAIAEVKRPLDEQMARLNATVVRLNEENDRLRADGGSAKADSDPLFVAVNAVHEKDERQRMHDQGVRDGLHPPVPPKHKPVA